MKAITVRYLGPTNYRGSRLKAKDSYGNSITIPYNAITSHAAAYAEAAIALCHKMGWSGELVSGEAGPGQYVFCFTASDTYKI